MFDFFKKSCSGLMTPHVIISRPLCSGRDFASYQECRGKKCQRESDQAGVEISWSARTVVLKVSMATFQGLAFLCSRITRKLQMWPVSSIVTTLTVGSTGPFQRKRRIQSFTNLFTDTAWVGKSMSWTREKSRVRSTETMNPITSW